MYNLYSKSKSELFGFERMGVGGAGGSCKQQLTQRFQWRLIAGTTLEGF